MSEQPIVHAVPVEPFAVPSLVRASPQQRDDEKIYASPTWPLAEVSAVVLAQLCDQFRAAVFAKAGKSDPASCRDMMELEAQP